MSHYRANLRDIEFNLFEVLDRQAILGQGLYADLDRDTVSAILAETEHLATTKLAASFAAGDRVEPVFDPQAHTVALPEEFRKSYRALMAGGTWQLEIPAELGGTPTPPTVQWAVNEMTIGANPALVLYAGGPKFASIVWAYGNERDQRTATLMVERGWGATMVLTEPEAGSDVGAGRTRAAPQADGSWQIEGVKRFITSGEHDLTENIIHLVLARPEGAGPGTKGLSLFVVPKFHFDPQTGALGARNGVFVTGIEHKMGIRASTTCEMAFGTEGTPAVGWLLGEVHDGIAQMFQVIEHARMLVGTKAIATLSSGYLNALDYAKTRVQGPDLLRASDKTAPRVTIAHHPDVRRSLLTQKSFAEGLRALVLFTASIQDRVAVARAEGREDDAAHRLNDLLLPIVKGYGSERSWVVLGTESLQTFGGSGFVNDYPLEQYVRDAKIDTLYEGTTAIQGQDLFFRKIVRDQRRALGDLSGQMQQWLAGEGGNGQLKVERGLLTRALVDVDAIVTTMTQDLQTAGSGQGDPRVLYQVGLNTTRLLMALGDVTCAWLLLRGAEIALARLNEPQSADEQAFYEGKLASARWFARTVLPKLAAERVIAESIDLAAMDLAEAAF